MIWMSGTVRGLAVMAAVAWAIAGCGSEGSPEEGRARGVVEAVDVAARTVTLDHEEVPGLMGAMTMEFEVGPEVEIDGLTPGAEVEFWVEYEAGGYTVTRIRRDGS